jgi:hypothetical protein
MLELAEKHGIPLEIEGNCRYITSVPAAAEDAGAGGTPAITLKSPPRYTDGPVESCSVCRTSSLLAGSSPRSSRRPRISTCRSWTCRRRIAAL